MRARARPALEGPATGVRALVAGRLVGPFAVMLGLAPNVGAVPPLLPSLADAFALSAVGAAWVMSAFGLARLAIDIPVGYLADRVGRRRCFVWAGGALTAGALICAVAPVPGVLYVGRILAGAGHSASTLMILVLVLASAPPSARSRAGSLLEATIMGTFLASGLAVGPVSEALGWRAAFGLLAAGSLAATAAGARLAGWRVVDAAGAEGAPGSGPRAHGSSRTGAAGRADDAAGAGAGPGREGDAAAGAGGGTALLRPCTAAFAVAFTWSGVLLTLVPLTGAPRLGLTATDLGRVLALAYAADLALVLPLGAAADRYGARRVLAAALAASAVFAPLVLVAPGAGWLAAGVALLGGTFGVWILPATLLVRTVPRGSQARMVGIYRFTADLAFMAAPVVMAAAAGRGGIAAAAAIAAAVPAAAALALGLPLRVTRR